MGLVVSSNENGVCPFFCRGGGGVYSITGFMNGFDACSISAREVGK